MPEPWQFEDEYSVERVWLGALWGKSASKAGGCRNLLLSNMLDTAAVAEFLWDEYLAPVTRRVLEELAGGAWAGASFVRLVVRDS